MTAAAPFSSRCRTCGRELSPDAASCAHCGAPNLEERCPHCGAVTTCSPDSELRYKCDLCGGPRIPRMDPALRKGRRDTPALRRANDARKARAKHRAIATMFGLVGLGSTAIALLWLLIFSLSFSLFVAWGLFAAPSLLAVLWAVNRAKAKTKEIRPAIDEAWQRAAAGAASSMKAPFTASALAQAMGIDETLAEELLAQLDANDVLRSDVTDAGEIAYQPKFRFGPGDTALGSEAEDEALAEAEAAEGRGGAKAQR